MPAQGEGAAPPGIRRAPSRYLQGGLPGGVDDLRRSALVQERLVQNIDPGEGGAVVTGGTSLDLEGMNCKGNLIEESAHPRPYCTLDARSRS